MDRRNVLISAAGAGVVALAGADGVAAAPAIRTQPRATIVAKDRTRLFHRDWGTGKPVVFLSGWALNSEAWAYQVAALSDQGLRCIAYDRRGHGRSDDASGGYDFDTLADDLAVVLETLDLREVTLVAHSMAGGEITRYLTRHGSGRVSKALYLAPITPFLLQTPDNPQGAPAAYFEQNRQAWMRDYPGWLDDNGPPFVTPETSPAMRDWIKGLMLQCSMHAVLACAKSMTTTDFRQELTKITVPSLVIQGDKDASAPLPLTGQRTAALIPGAKLKVYEGTPHGLFVTHIERLNADILAFARG
jgi:non-heme chloroperoxidase